MSTYNDLVYRIVNRALNEELSRSIQESKRKRKKPKDNKRGNKLKVVEKFFKNKGVNIAPYAYDLFKVEVVEGDDTNEMKNARSLFYKKLNHDVRESDGYEYKFNSKEINSLYSQISSNQMNESINRAVSTSIRKLINRKML